MSDCCYHCDLKMLNIKKATIALEIASLLFGIYACKVDDDKKMWKPNLQRYLIILEAVDLGSLNGTLWANQVLEVEKSEVFDLHIAWEEAQGRVINLNHKNEEDIKNYKIVMHKLKNKENPNSISFLNDIDIINKIEKTEIEDKKVNISNDSDKKVNEKKKKYISPFPVPGYESDENLWEFVCDLNEKELKVNQPGKETYTGIKHLLKNKSEKNKIENSKN